MALLATELGLPALMHTTSGIPFSSVEGLCIMCNFLAYPVRYGSMERLFGRGASTIRSINNRVMAFLIEKYRVLITQLDFTRITPDRLQVLADAVDAKGALLKGVFGFLDGTAVYYHALCVRSALSFEWWCCTLNFLVAPGTLREVCRPTDGQESIYNGKDRLHGLKLQGTVTSDGIVVVSGTGVC